MRSVKTRLQVQVTPGRQLERSTVDNGDKQTVPVLDGELKHYTSTLDAISRIIFEDGPSGLYIGMTGALVGVASTNFAYFYWYSIIKSLYTRSNPRNGPKLPSTGAELSLGAVAGALAQICTIPVAVVTTRQQTSREPDRKGLISTVREIVSDDGVSGLWRGLKASLVLVVNPAITYGAYERLKGTIFPGRSSLRPWESFGMSAFGSRIRF